MLGQDPFRNWRRANWLAVLGFALLIPNMVWRSQHDRSRLVIVILLLAGFAVTIAAALWRLCLYFTTRCPYCNERVATLTNRIQPPRSCRHCGREFL